jgi:hypothetical protein
MDLKSEILKEHSKRQCVRLGDWIGQDKKRFKQLMELFLHDEYRVTQRSAWIVSYCADRHPELITPWLKPMLLKTREPGVHVAVRRNVMRILQNIEIPSSLLGTVITIGFDELETPDSPIAVKAFAMTVLANIARKKPDIIPELRAAVDFATLNATPGIRVRCRRVLKQIIS